MFTDRYAELKNCYTCKKIEVVHSTQCRQYLDHDVMDTGKYSTPLVSQLQAELDGTCFMLYHTGFYIPSCINCVKAAFPEATQFHDTTTSSVLFDTSKCELKFNPNAFHKLLECHDVDICSRIQKVPNDFCSHHQAFTSNAELVKGDKLNQLEANRIPIGAWPPQIHSIIVKQDEMWSQKSSETHSELTFG